MTRVRVIGVGSPNGDDAVGWWLADALRRSDHDRAGPEVEIIKLDRPGVAILDHLRGAAAAVVVDAMVETPADPCVTVGTIRHLSVDDIASTSNGTSSHGLGLGQALGLGRALGVLPDRLRVLAVRVSAAGVSRTRWDAGPSDAMGRALETMLDELRRVVDELAGGDRRLEPRPGTSSQGDARS